MFKPQQLAILAAALKAWSCDTIVHVATDVAVQITFDGAPQAPQDEWLVLCALARDGGRATAVIEIDRDDSGAVSALRQEKYATSIQVASALEPIWAIVPATSSAVGASRMMH